MTCVVFVTVHPEGAVKSDTWMSYFGQCNTYILNPITQYLMLIQFRVLQVQVLYLSWSLNNARNPIMYLVCWVTNKLNFNFPCMAVDHFNKDSRNLTVHTSIVPKVSLFIVLSRGFNLRLYIHRLFPCGMCPCSLVMCHTDNEPLFSGSIHILYPLSKTTVFCVYGASQGNKGTHHKGLTDHIIQSADQSVNTTRDVIISHQAHPEPLETPLDRPEWTRLLIGVEPGSWNYIIVSNKISLDWFEKLNKRIHWTRHRTVKYILNYFSTTDDAKNPQNSRMFKTCLLWSTK